MGCILSLSIGKGKGEIEASVLQSLIQSVLYEVSFKIYIFKTVFKSCYIFYQGFSIQYFKILAIKFVKSRVSAAVQCPRDVAFKGFYIFV